MKWKRIKLKGTRYIKKENEELKRKVSCSNEILEKFKIGSKRLDEMFSSQMSGLNKEDLDYNVGKPFIKNYKPLMKAHTLHVKYKICAFIGHTIGQYPIKNDKSFKIKKVWVHKRALKTNPIGPKIVWVPKGK